MRRIAVLGNPCLRTPPPAVVDFDERLSWRVERMTELMHATGGVGLAAPQIAYFRQLFVWDLNDSAGGDESGLRGGFRSTAGAICNPAIIERSEEMIYEPEGCLSIPGLTVAIHRAAEVTIEGFTPVGDELRIEAKGLLARVFQHETDHLQGKLIIDRTSGFARAAVFGGLRELDIQQAVMSR